MIKGVDLPPLRKDVDYQKKEEWCGILCKCIEEKILPFYRQIETPELLAQYVEKKAFLSSCFFSCPELFLSRLKVFSYLYLDDPAKVSSVLTQYRKILFANTFLTETVRRMYLEESDKIESLIHNDEKNSTQYIASIITNTRKKL